MKSAFYVMMSFLSVLVVGHAFANTPIFSIEPSLSSTIVRSDSETSVSYIVTNNANVSINSLSITPGYQTTGSSSGLSMQNDQCSGLPLSAHSHCTFDLIIAGANQPSSFVITPKVCGNGGQACSTTSSTNQLTVNVDLITQAPYAYFEAKAVGAVMAQATPVAHLFSDNSAQSIRVCLARGDPPPLSSCDFVLKTVNTQDTAAVGASPTRICLDSNNPRFSS